MNKYPRGNSEVLQMIYSGFFDSHVADKLLKDVNLDSPICDEHGYSTTYLCEAVDYNNLPAAKYLLEHGADANFYNSDLTNDYALWGLQYLYEGQDLQIRYEISKLFFKYGADPHIEYETESFYDYVVFKIFYDDVDEDEKQNLLNIYKIMLLYDADKFTVEHIKYEADKIDLDRIDEYHVEILPHEDKYHIIGNVVDKAGNAVISLYNILDE